MTGLQEAQLLALCAIDERIAQQQAEAGVSVERIAVRSEVEIAKLRRTHDVYVAEADGEPAGYLAWVDQPPGVAVLELLQVDPALQRFGIATRLLRELADKAARHGIRHCACPAFKRDKAAISFLAKRGFLPLEAGPLPAEVAEWLERAPLPPDQQLWWAKTDGLGLIPGLPRPESE